MPTSLLPAKYTKVQHCPCGKIALYRFSGSNCCSTCKQIEQSMNNFVTVRSRNCIKPENGRNYCDIEYKLGFADNGKVNTKAPKI